MLDSGARTARLLRAVSAVARHAVDPAVMIPSFPVDYFDADGRSKLGATTGLTYLGQESLAARPASLFGAEVVSVVYARLDGPSPWYTAFALTRDGTVAYFDYPEP